MIVAFRVGREKTHCRGTAADAKATIAAARLAVETHRRVDPPGLMADIEVHIPPPANASVSRTFDRASLPGRGELRYANAEAK
jgi:hypothetical protein